MSRSQRLKAVPLVGLCVCLAGETSAQLTEWTLPNPDSAGIVFSTDLEVLPTSESIMSAYTYSYIAPGLSAPGLLASMMGGTVTWSKGFVGDSSYYIPLADTMIFGGLRGSIHSITAVQPDSLLITGSAYSNERANAMVALLGTDGDTAWTTLVGEGGPPAPVFTDAVRAVDGSFYCVGLYEAQSWTTIAARFTARGELIWYRTLDMPESSSATRRCFTQGDTLLVFSGMEPDSTSSGITVMRISAAGEFLDSQRLFSPTGFRLKDVTQDENGGFILFCDSMKFMLQPPYSSLLVLHLAADLQPLGPQFKVSYAHAISTKAGRIVYDAATDRVFIVHVSNDALEANSPFTLCLSLAQPEIVWEHMLDNFGTSGLHCALAGTGDQTALRILYSLVGNLPSHFTLAMETATGALHLDPTCTPEPPHEWTLTDSTISVVWQEETITLIGPETFVSHGLTVLDLPLSGETCPLVCDTVALGPINGDNLVHIDGTYTFSVAASDTIQWLIPDDWTPIGPVNDTSLVVMVGGEDQINVQVCARVLSTLCPDSVCISVFVDGNVAVPGRLGPLAIHVYPNPVRDYCTIQVEGVGADAWLEVSDLMGRSMLKQALRSTAVTLDVSMLAPGAYVLRSVNGQEYSRASLVVER